MMTEGKIALAAVALAAGTAMAKTQREAEIAAVRAMAELEMYPPEIKMNPTFEDFAPRVFRYGMNGGAVQQRVKKTVKYPEDWGFAMNGSVSVTKKGRLWATWLGGEDGPEGFVIGAKSDDGGKTWGNPAFVLDPHFKDDRILNIFPVMRAALCAETWVDPNGALHLLATITVGTPMVRGCLWDYVCRDPDAAKPVWEKPKFLGWGAVPNPPTVLKDGTWIIPIEVEGGVSDDCFPELVPLRRCGALRSRDGGKTWERGASVQVKGTDYVIEHCIVERADGSLWMLMRSDLGIHEAFSSDGGMTWSEARKATWIDNPITRFSFLKLRSGNLLLVKNGDSVTRCDGVHCRNKLKAYISKDEGKTWSAGYELDMRGWADYPDAAQGPDGRIAISWGVDRRGLAEIRCVVLTEEEIAAGKTIGTNNFGGVRVFRSVPATMRGDLK